MAVNLPKIADTPYLSLYCNSTKQNDNITMTFPVNLSLQCLRTAALSMVTLNMESRNPMGRVYAENRSKTQKPLGFKGLTPWKFHIHKKSKTSVTYFDLLGTVIRFSCSCLWTNNCKCRCKAAYFFIVNWQTINYKHLIWPQHVRYFIVHYMYIYVLCGYLLGQEKNCWVMKY